MKLSENIIFIRLTFSLPSQSRKISATAENVQANRISASARLFTGAAFAAIKSADTGTRARLLSLAIPVPSAFRGAYVLPRRLLDRAVNLLESAKNTRDDLVINFIADSYDAERERAKAELGAAFDSRDFPEPGVLQTRFDMGWSLFQIDVPQDLPAGVRESESAKLREQINTVAVECREALRTGLLDMINRLAESLKPGEDGKVKRLHETAVENLREFLDTLADRDITSDDQIRAIGEQAKAIIGTTKADDLRDSKSTAEKVRARLAEVGAELGALVSVSGQRKFDLDLE